MKKHCKANKTLRGKRQIMEQMNYAKWLTGKLGEVSKLPEKPKLLLHACCAPCSSYVIEYLAPYFDIDLLFYNPNIQPYEEYVRRANELVTLPAKSGIDAKVTICPYTPEDFLRIAKGKEDDPEGGERCTGCFGLRLGYTAKYASDNEYDFFCTTLSVSPYKNARLLNSIGEKMSQLYGVRYLFSDFKKNDGYKKSCQLSQKLGLYRQDYCGCIYSKAERMKRTGMTE